MKVIRVHENGGPEKLIYEDVPAADPGPGQARVENHVSGVNYIDTYHREGLYPIQVPFTLGVEGAGIVTEVGPGVSEVQPGDRVAYGLTVGSYAQETVVEASKLVPLPEGVDFATGATAMVQGMTAHYLTHGCVPLNEGDSILAHAAAGGVGLLLVQMGKLLGLKVFGTVSTPEKAQLASHAGADHVILYSQTDFAAEIESLTGGEGVRAVYDGVGQATFDQSTNCLKPRGYMVLYGQASGPVRPVDPQILNDRGSIFLTRPSLFHYAADRDELLARAGDVFQWIAADRLQVRIGATYPLSEAAQAHRDLQGRKTTGKLVLQTR